MSGWIGVDLDATLAEYNGWKGIAHIGKPIPKMLERVKFWLLRGYEVKIFTARFSEGEEQITFIQDWLEEECDLPRLEVTNVKDFKMIALWDDRCFSVIPNTGEIGFNPQRTLLDK